MPTHRHVSCVSLIDYTNTDYYSGNDFIEIAFGSIDKSRFDRETGFIYNLFETNCCSLLLISGASVYSSCPKPSARLVGDLVASGIFSHSGLLVLEGPIKRTGSSTSGIW